MKINVDHLKGFLKNNASIDDISSKLMQLGHENIVTGNNLDLDITPNRGDCLSLLGLARELKHFYGFDSSKIDTFNGEIEDLDLDFINRSKETCPEISFLSVKVKNIKKYYKPYLENYFKDLALNKNNFFTDISNYLSYELGQPTHCYDFEKLNEPIELLEENRNIEFETLLGKKIILKNNNLIFNDKKGCINLAGIMGGKESSCTDETRIALIECAYFEPESVVGKALSYDIASEAAHKFERGTDRYCHDFVLRRFIKIIEDHADIVDIKLFTQSYKEYKPKIIKKSISNVEEILGIKIDYEDFDNILNNLGFQTKDSLTVPSYRHDIENTNDVSEEIARIIGYDSINARNFEIKKTFPQKVKFDLRVKEFLIEKGFNEVINFPFSDKDSENAIAVDNPLDVNKKYLRTNLEDSMIENLIYNEKRQKDSIKLFEISDLYFKDKQQNISKKRALGLIVSGRVDLNYRDFVRIIDKSIIKDIFAEVQSAFTLKTKEISRKDLNSKIKYPIYYAEISLDEIPYQVIDHKTDSKIRFNGINFREISNFPSTYRDLSFMLSPEIDIDSFLERMLNHKDKILKESFIFDFFINKKKNEIKVGIRFIFQSTEKTLVDEEVDSSMSHIVKLAFEGGGVKIPGLGD